MKDVLWDDGWVHRMSSSSLGRGIGAGTDGRDASEKHQRDFIPANVVTHEEVTEGHELLASEGFCEEIGGIVVGPDMEHFQQAVTHVVTYVVPARFESFVVDVDGRVVGGEHRSFVVAKDGWCKVNTG